MRRQDEGGLGDVTLQDIADDYNFPIEFIYDVLCRWGVSPPIKLDDKLGDLVNGEQVGILPSDALWCKSDTSGVGCGAVSRTTGASEYFTLCDMTHLVRGVQITAFSFKQAAVPKQPVATAIPADPLLLMPSHVQQAFAVLEAMTSVDCATVHDFYLDETIEELAWALEVQLSDIFAVCGRRRFNLPLGADTHLTNEEYRFLLKVSAQLCY
jgi:hypothetical protein